MARLAYGDENSSPAVRALADQIRKERDGRMLNLYSMLLNAPPVAEGWLALFTAIRQQCTLRGDYRELVILRVALLNGASYEYQVHVPFALREGVTQAQLDTLDRWQDSAALTEAQKAVLAYTDAMTRDIHVPDDVFDVLRGHFNQREIVELTATIGGYNLVSRFLEALAVDPESAHV
ncbi:MAG: carboxymuconolactone decarboxylase family protein [Betaproteobacteria bacterium]